MLGAWKRWIGAGFQRFGFGLSTSKVRVGDLTRDFAEVFRGLVIADSCGKRLLREKVRVSDDETA